MCQSWAYLHTSMRALHLKRLDHSRHYFSGSHFSWLFSGFSLWETMVENGQEAPWSQDISLPSSLLQEVFPAVAAISFMALVPYQEIPTSSEELWLLITHSPTIRDTVLSTLLLISRLLHHPILLSQLLHHLYNQALHLNSHLFLCVFSRIRLFETMDCSWPGSSVHGNFQTRIVEWVAISSSRGSS